MVLALKVPRNEAERIRRKLLREGNLASEWSIVAEGDYVLIPIRRPVEGCIDIDLPRRWGKIPPYEKIVEKLREEGISAVPPEHWEKLGDVVLIPDTDIRGRELRKVAEAFAEVLGAETVALHRGILGEFRENRIEVIIGESTETMHVENGIKYRMDVSRVMFSSGNVNERIRISRMNMRGETIVDMFAGIGYFTLPAAKAGASRIYACEKNPVAFYYLLENIGLNEFSNIVPLFGDNRDVCPERVADRVIMGYFDTLPFVPHALKSLKNGGIIHYHDLARRKDALDLEEKVMKEIARRGFTAEILERRVVKSYAPHVWHVVLDIEVER